MAVGPDDIVLATNQDISLFDKSGSEQWSIRSFGEDGFWDDVPGWSNCTDCSLIGLDHLVLYDSVEDRFWITAFEQKAPGQTVLHYLLIAVSSTASPGIGDWYKYRVNLNDVTGINDALWLTLDRPNSSVHPEELYISFWGGKCFQAGCGTGAGIHSAVVVLLKEEMLEGDPITEAKGLMLPEASWRKVTPFHGVKHDASDTSPLYMIEIDLDFPSNHNQSPPVNTAYTTFALHAVTGGFSDPEITEEPFVLGSGTTYYSPEECDPDPPPYQPCAPQDNTDVSLLLDSPRILHGVYRDGYLYAVQHARNSTTAGSPAITRFSVIDMNGWYDPDPDNEPELARGDWIAPEGGKWTIYPSVAVNEHGQALVTFNQTSDDEYVSIRHWQNHNNQIDTAKSSDDFYTGNGGTLQRWGDYSTTVLDPEDECTFWSAHLFVEEDGSPAGSTVWRIWVSKHVIPGVDCPPSNFGGGDNPGPSPTFLRRLDFNKDGFVDVYDILEFQNYFDRKHRRADWNRDGSHDVLDFIGYMNDFRAAQ